jgi:hypothetical protein
MSEGVENSVIKFLSLVSYVLQEVLAGQICNPF